MHLHMLDEYFIFQDHKISLKFTRTYIIHRNPALRGENSLVSNITKLLCVLTRESIFSNNLTRT